VAQGLRPEEAIEKLLPLRPGSREILHVPGQKDAVFEFYHRNQKGEGMLLRVGAQGVSYEEAAGWIESYTKADRSRDPYAYPYYDELRTTDDPVRLVDGDFLAPALLNAFRGSPLKAFRSLKLRETELSHALDTIDPVLDLAEADDDSIGLLGPLFHLLEDHGIPGVQGTTLSKVLHRKRPRFIPLFDDHVRKLYQEMTGAPIPRDPKRTWGEFFVLLAQEMRSNLLADLDGWDRLTRLAPSLTRLRALDIVAWCSAKDCR
jgi:hypothetical protein